MQAINLIEKHKSNQSLNRSIDKFVQNNKLEKINSRLNLKAGDVVEFWSGHDRDILYRSEIKGFFYDGSAAMLWDCYWFPVDLEARRFKKITSI